MPRNLSHILIGAVCHPPNGNNRNMVTHILNCLDRCTKDHPNLGILLMGDFNSLPDTLLKGFPLKQIVRVPTRGQAILDKIYTNIADWFNNPVILPAIGKSDHQTDMAYITSNPNWLPGEDITVHRRVCDRNSKILLAHALKNFNWCSLYRMDFCDDMLTYFTDVLTAMLDCYMPLCPFKHHSSEKPWVSDSFRQLIRRRQFAFRSGNVAQYKKLRNATQRAAKQLRQQYYNRKIKQLRSSDPRKWWQSVKRFIGTDQAERSEVSNLATQLNYDEDCALASDINEFFAGVASDLLTHCGMIFVTNLFATAIHVQNTQLNHGRSKLNCHESSCVRHQVPTTYQIGSCRKCHRLLLNQFARFSMHHFTKGVCL